MSNAIEKYRKQDSLSHPKKAVSKKKKKTARNDEANAGYEDQLLLSPEALEHLHLAQEDEDQEEASEVQLQVHENDLDENDMEAASEEAPKKEKLSRNNLKLSTGDQLPEDREEIIVMYAPLIKYIAQKIAARLPSNIELDDLISSGVIGLMDAIDKYDPSRDNKFKTYAEFRIRGAILDELRAQDWVPRSVREKAKMLERAYTKIEHEKGRPATDEEVCEELRISQEEYYDLLNQVRSVSLLSYDDMSSSSKNDRRSMLGLAESSKTNNPFVEINSAHLKQMVAAAIGDLPEKQRLVLSLYYYEDLNLKEIGKVLEVTESRVSQLHTQAIIRLKAKLKGHFDDFLAIMD